MPRAGTIGFGDIHCSRLPQDEQVADAILFIQRLGSESCDRDTLSKLLEDSGKMIRPLLHGETENLPGIFADFAK